MAASYKIVGVTSSSITIRITPDRAGGYLWYRVFARLTSDPNDATYEGRAAILAESDVVIDGLQPNTSYTVNVYHSTDGSANSYEPLPTGAMEQTTLSEAPETGGYARIYVSAGYVNGVWRPARWAYAIPWIFSSGQWRLTMPWVFKNNSWKLTV